MLSVYPDYYHSFSCIKGACKHSCCIGWEIDISPEYAEEYLRLKGPLGEKMKKSVSLEGTPHFCLDERERCPFLNEEGLCALILEAGQEYLTEICREHPRFYNERGERSEMGLGLCCEEACRIILTKKEPMTLIYDGERDEPDSIIKQRDGLLRVLSDRRLPYNTRQKEMLALCGYEKLLLSSKDLAKIMLSLEMMDEQWGELLRFFIEKTKSCHVAAFERHLEKEDRFAEFENLTEYLIYRHYISGFDVDEANLKGLFALQASRLLFEISATLFAERGKMDTDDLLELCRLFSSEIEYSDENPEILADKFYELT